MIEAIAPPELGEKYPATIWKVKTPDELDDSGFGPQIQVLLITPEGQTLSRYLPVPATKRNRTGRILASLYGTYPTGTIDEQTLVGMTVDVIYAAKKGDPDELVIDLFKPRTPAKGEDPAATVAKAIEADDKEAPF